MPGHELIEFYDLVVSDATKVVDLRIGAVGLRRFDQRIGWRLICRISWSPLQPTNGIDTLSRWSDRASLGAEEILHGQSRRARYSSTPTRVPSSSAWNGLHS